MQCFCMQNISEINLLITRFETTFVFSAFWGNTRESARNAAAERLDRGAGCSRSLETPADSSTALAVRGSGRVTAQR